MYSSLENWLLCKLRFKKHLSLQAERAILPLRASRGIASALSAAVVQAVGSRNDV